MLKTLRLKRPYIKKEKFNTLGNKKKDLCKISPKSKRIAKGSPAKAVPQVN